MALHAHDVQVRREGLDHDSRAESEGRDSQASAYHLEQKRRATAVLVVEGVMPVAPKVEVVG